MKDIFKDYLDNKIELERWQKVGIFCLIVVVSGCIGWVYEFIFYYFNGGMKEFYLQGGNFLPWINIYAIGAILIILTTRKLKKHPVVVFLVTMLVTGILEYVAGWLVYKIGNGTRFWDYNVEILNFGNIDGFVCLRSVLVFGVAGLALTYFILPLCIYLSKIMPKNVFLGIAITLCVIFLADEFYNGILTRLFHVPSAVDIYKSLGFKYVS